MFDPGYEGQVLILDWLDPERPNESYIRLYEIGVPFYGVKEAFRTSLRETTVLMQPAYWVPGIHRLQLKGENGPESITVFRDVLIWTDDVVTYRLESDLSMNEAVRIAESLKIYK